MVRNQLNIRPISPKQNEEVANFIRLWKDSFIANKIMIGTLIIGEQSRYSQIAQTSTNSWELKFQLKTLQLSLNLFILNLNST